MANRFTKKKDTCPGCGKEYPAFYHKCPYCDAQWKSMQIARKKWVRPLGETITAVLLALVVLGGAAFLTARAFAIDRLTIGREYEIEEVSDELNLNVNVTGQDADLTDATATEGQPGVTYNPESSVAAGTTDETENTDETEYTDEAEYTDETGYADTADYTDTVDYADTTDYTDGTGYSDADALIANAVG